MLFGKSYVSYLTNAYSLALISPPLMLYHQNYLFFVHISFFPFFFPQWRQKSIPVNLDEKDLRVEAMPRNYSWQKWKHSKHSLFRTPACLFLHSLSLSALGPVKP